MRHVVSFSGGAGSWATARRVADEHGTDDLVLLVADTNSEADDWRPFVDACHADVGGELVMLDNGGRSVWDVFDEQGFIGNSRVDICSRILKREPLRAWLEAECDPAGTVVYLGFDWTEAHRMERARPHWEPWTVAAPMMDPPHVQKAEVLDMLRERGIPVPLLYEQGYPHNNCAGACVKAGHKQWRILLREDRERYLEVEAWEQRFRDRTGKDVAILRDRSMGDGFGSCSCMTELDPRAAAEVEVHIKTSKPLTLAALRESVDAQGVLPL